MVEETVKPDKTSNGNIRLTFDPTKIRFWVWFFGRGVALLAVLYLAVSWVAAREFENQLDRFHQIAKPAISAERQADIEAHEQAARLGHQTEHAELSKSLAIMESDIGHVHDLVWTLYQRELGNQPPKPSPYRNGRIPADSPG